MSATFEWSIVSMTSYPQYEQETDVVFKVFWQCVGTETRNGITFVKQAGASSDVTYTGGTAFTPYDQLTQQQVLGWVWAVQPKDETEAYVQGVLDTQFNPIQVNLPLPWASPTP